MKKKIAAITTAANLSTTAAALKAAQEAAKAAKQDFRDEVIAVAASLPEGTYILNKDIARDAGMSPANVANIIAVNGDRALLKQGVKVDNTTVTRRFVEVDEDGQPVKGGEVKVIRQDLTIYRKATKEEVKRGW